ncbi:MAG: TolC family protein [Firmicutes bacterium]|nr:TolC family protein [Bacillota bacterium]
MNKRRIFQLVLAVLLLSLAAPAVALAYEPQCPELTLDEAISRALRHSRSVERSVLDVVYADEARDDVAVMWDPQWTVTYVPGTEGIYAALLSADFGYDAAEKQKEIQEDIVVVETIKSYYDLLVAQGKVSSARGAVAAQEVQFEKMKAYFEAGMVPRIAFDQALTELARKRAELASAENELDNAYAAFNLLVGLRPEDRPVLVDEPEYREIEVSSLSSEVSSIVKDNPAQWIADEGAELQERLIGFSEGGDLAEIRAEQAELDADELRDDTLKLLYQLYYNIRTLEKTIDTLAQSIELAEDNLRVTQLKFEVGMATKADLASAENALEQTRQELFELTCQHELLKEVFYKPWTAGVVFGSGKTGGSSS